LNKLFLISILLFIFSFPQQVFSELPSDKIRATHEKCLFIAKTIEKFEKISGNSLERLSQIRKFIPNIDEIKDSWGTPFFTDINLKLIYSIGPDKKHDLSNLTTLKDDIIVYWTLPSKNIDIVKTESNLRFLRNKILKYNKENTEEIDLLTQLEKDSIPQLDSWNSPFILDTKENLILSLGSDKTRDSILEDDIIFSYDTNSIQVKKYEMELNLKKIAKSVELYFNKNKKLPQLTELGKNINLTDYWGRNFKINKEKSFIYSMGKNGRSCESKPYTTFDDIRVSFSLNSDDDQSRKIKEFLKLISDETLKFISFKNRLPNSIPEMKLYGYCLKMDNIYDSYGNAIHFSNGKIISPGRDGIDNSSDDIIFDLKKISNKKKNEITKTIIDFIGEKVTLFKLTNERTIENLLQLRYSGYLDDIYTMRDSWNNRFYIDVENNFVYSMGQDGKHSLRKTSNWNDDITCECGINTEIGKKLYKENLVKIEKRKVSKTKIELKKLGLEIRIRDRAIGRRKLTARRLGKPLSRKLKAVRDPFGEKYNLNYRKKIIFSSGKDKIKGTKDDISLCWKKIKIPKKKRKSKKRKKKRRRRRR